MEMTLSRALRYKKRIIEKIRKLETIWQEASKAASSELNASDASGLNSAAPGADDAIYPQSKKMFYQRLLTDSIRKPHAFECAAVAQIDERAQQIIRKQLDGPQFFRGIEAVNWMLRYRWLISAAHEKTEAEPYYFSLVSDLFDYVALEMYSADKQEFRGFLVLSIRIKKGRTWVKILDYAFNDPFDGDLAAYQAMIYAEKFNADRLEFPADLLNYFEQQPLLQPLIKKQQRRYLFYPKRQGSVLDDCVGKIKFDYCDADTTFT